MRFKPLSPSRTRRRARGIAVLIGVLACLGLCPPGGRAAPAEFADPAPPPAEKLPPAPPAAAKDNPDAAFRAAPKPLPAGAVTHDWTGFLGPTYNLVSTETKLLHQFPEGGPTLVWEVAKGSGYAAPAVHGERLVLFHRVGDAEVVDCLHPETGKRYWRFQYPCTYADRYGYNDGPRCAPVITPDGKSVYTYGSAGALHCLELATGRVRWKREILKEFKLRQNFFGVGATPLVEAGVLIVNVGAPGGPCVAGFDLETGKMAWGAGDEWGPSYASPVPVEVHGKRRVLVFAGGESEPPSGGLMVVDPKNGAVEGTFEWRGRRRESVNASSPLLVTGDRVFVSECYGSGGALVQVAPDGSCKPLWENESFGTHFMVAVEHEGHLYGVDGHGPGDAFLVCADLKTGEEVWRTQPAWQETIKTPAGPRKIGAGTYRAWIMPVDGGFLYLGEFGHLLWVDLSPKGYKELSRATLFLADQTWTPPVLSRGLLYVCQNTEGRMDDSKPRLLCYDLRQDERQDAKTPREEP